MDGFIKNHGACSLSVGSSSTGELDCLSCRSGKNCADRAALRPTATSPGQGTAPAREEWLVPGEQPHDAVESGGRRRQRRR